MVLGEKVIVGRPKYRATENTAKQPKSIVFEMPIFTPTELFFQLWYHNTKEISADIIAKDLVQNPEFTFLYGNEFPYSMGRLAFTHQLAAPILNTNPKRSRIFII